MIIFVVIGHAGEYADYSTWMTKGFEHEVDAEKYMQLCANEATRITLEIQELDDTKLKEWRDTGNPSNYYELHNKIISSNTVDEFFYYDEPIKYTINKLEIK